MRTAVSSALMLTALLLGCSGLRFHGSFRSGPHDWIMLGGGPARTNASTANVRPPFRLLWEYNAQGGIIAQPLLRDSVIVVSTLHGEIQAVHVRTGKRLGYESAKLYRARTGLTRRVRGFDAGNWNYGYSGY